MITGDSLPLLVSLYFSKSSGVNNFGNKKKKFLAKQCCLLRNNKTYIHYKRFRKFKYLELISGNTKV